jgi:hypothetical protein
VGERHGCVGDIAKNAAMKGSDSVGVMLSYVELDGDTPGMNSSNVKSEIGPDREERRTVAKTCSDLIEFGRGSVLLGHWKDFKLFHKEFVGVAPHPVFTRFEGTNDGVLGVAIVGGGMFVFGGVATSDVSAGKAEAQVNPRVAHFKAFLATFTAGSDFMNLVEV